MKKNYYIGGSPCAMKTSIAEKISEEFSMKLYNVDNHIERYLEIGAKKRNRTLKKMNKISVLDQWFEDVDKQFENEIELYSYAGKIIDADLKRYYRNKNVIVEGAPIIPAFIHKRKIDPSCYIVLVPSRSFQYSIYKEREYIDRYLNLTEDKEKAFENWIERDSKIAMYYKEEASKYDYKCIVVESQSDFDGIYEQVVEHFELREN